MSKHVIAVASLAAALTFALVAPAASASSGSPTSPISTNGHQVELVVRLRRRRGVRRRCWQL
jgi:hypothetical protein